MTSLLTEIVELDGEALRNRGYRLQFSRSKQLEMLQDFNTLMRYLPPLRAIQHIGNYAEGAKQVVCEDIARSIRAGKGIANGMEYWFDPILVEVVRIGETSGGFSELLEKTIEQMGQQHGSFRSAVMMLIYPAFVTLIVCGAAVGLHERLIPLVEGLARGRPLPPDLRFLKDFGEFVQVWGIPLVACLGAAVVALRWVLVNYTGHMRDAMDPFPLFTQYRLLLGARFMQTYAILKSLSMNEVQIVRMAMGSGSPYYVHHLRHMLRHLRGGVENVVDALDTGLIHPEHVDRLKILSESAEYVRALEDTAKKVVKDTITKITVATRITATLWIAGCGYLVIRLVLAVMSVDEVAAFS